MTTKRRFIKHLPLMLAGLAMGLGVFINTKTTAKPSFSEVSAADYYNGVTDGMTGTTLLNKLNTIINTSNVSVSYDWSRYKAADEDPNNSSNVLTIYSRRSMAKTATDNGTNGDYWNREHTFPNSKITGNAESDNHIIYASEKKVNGTRSSLKMGVVNNGTVVNDNNGNATTCQKTSSLFDPHNVARGIVARTTMYAAAMYGLDPTDNFESIATMLRWHLEYQPDSNDVRRNNTVYSNQNNRNPFVDHPEYACRIWGSTNSTTQSICGATGSVSISDSSKSVSAGESFTLSATSSDSSTISWSSDTPSVANVSNGTANSGSSITITTGTAGSAIITASATISGNTYSATCNVTVTSSGSSGGSSNEYSLYSGSITEGDYLIVYDNKAMNSTVSSNRLMYETVTPSNNKITTSDSSIVWHIASNGNYWTIYNAEQGKYAAATNSNNQATLITSIGDAALWTVSGTSTYEFVNKSNSRNLRENTTYGYGCYTTSTGGALSLYKKTESSSSKTLSSISLSDKTTSYYVGDEFVKPTVTAIYSDNSTANVTNSTTFTGYDMSATGTQTVTASYTYGGTTKTATYSITISAKPITSISASVSRTFYVGETITTSDITVVDNNGDSVNSFTFSNNNYQFTYADSNSGGTTKVKTFTDSITGAGKTCSLTVNVARAAYVAPTTVTDTITASDLPATGTTYTNFSNISKSSNAKYAGNSAKNSDAAIQMRTTNNNSGIVSTTSGGTISSVTITVSSGTKTINVYGKNTAYSAATDLYSTSTQGTLVGSTSSTGTITFTTGYAYVGIRSNDGAIYLTSVAIKYGSGETAKNVANYIMYADTNNQCTSKLSIAVGYIKNMSSTEKTTFQTSNDYVISTARTRLEAWATNQGKTINYSSGTLSNSSRLVPLGNVENSNTIITMIIVSMVGVTSIGACLYIRKKRSR